MLALRRISACAPLVAAAVFESCARSGHCDAPDAQTAASSAGTFREAKAAAPLRTEVIFLGTGSSTGCPAPWCLMDKHAADPRCRVSRLAAEGDPKANRNYRCNPSLMLRVHHPDGPKCILFDAGKTFRESIVRWLPVHKIQSLDACILTHGHADAVFGLDDMRGMQTHPATEGIPIYLSQETLEMVKRTFHYLFPTSQPEVLVRHVARLDFHMIEPWQQLNICGVPMVPIPVMHGEDMVNLGFVIGENKKICYISDVSRIPERTMQYLMTLDLDLLIIDTLFKRLRHATHFSQQEAIELSKKLKPKRTYLLGMSSEFEHERDNAEMLKLYEDIGVWIQLSHDGLKLDVSL